MPLAARRGMAGLVTDGARGVTADVAAWCARAETAAGWLRTGRRRMATRHLVAAAAALERRGAWTQALAALEQVVRSDARRGRCRAARALLDRMGLTAEGHAPAWVSRIRLWTACALLDEGRLAEARAAVRLAREAQLSVALGVWATVLAAETGEDAAVDTRGLADLTDGGDSLTWGDHDVVGWCLGAVFRQALATGEFFEAGRWLAVLRRLAEAVDDDVARAGVAAAEAELSAGVADVHRCRRAVDILRGAGLRSGAVFDVVRACAAWVELTRRLGRVGEAAPQRRLLARLRPVVPQAWQQVIDDACGGAAPALAPCRRQVPSGGAAAIVRAVWQDGQGDGVREAVERSRALVHAEGLALVTCVPGGDRHVSSGEVDASDLVAAVVQSRHALGPTVMRTGVVLGVPVCVGGGVVGAVVARWASEDAVPADARDALDLTAAAVAPRVEALVTSMRQTVAAAGAMPHLVGASAGIAEVRRLVGRAASSPFAVLIEGESGVGKELVARALHQLGARRDGPWRDINCAALPDELLESELFGHVRGAFSGATADRVGLFEDAHEGTLFLDEVADLSPRAQAKVLRAIQQQEIRRVGESQARQVDVRIVAAANRDLSADVDAGRFRLDLFYRLAVVRIRIPPLRERPEDIRALVEQGWPGVAARMGSRARLADAIVARLERHAWPGNVRELQNVMAALAVAAPREGVVPVSALPPDVGRPRASPARGLAEARADVERQAIDRALATASGNRTAAARALGLSRQGLQKALRRLRTDRARLPGEAGDDVRSG